MLNQLHRKKFMYQKHNHIQYNILPPPNSSSFSHKALFFWSGFMLLGECVYLSVVERNLYYSSYEMLLQSRKCLSINLTTGRQGMKVRKTTVKVHVNFITSMYVWPPDFYANQLPTAFYKRVKLIYLSTPSCIIIVPWKMIQSNHTSNNDKHESWNVCEGIKQKRVKQNYLMCKQQKPTLQ